MKYNLDKHFAGAPGIKQRQKEQLELFEAWAQAAHWSEFHENHYDWWMFPVDEPSMYGLQWTVYEGDIVTLKQDAEFMWNYPRGIVLLARSWGWDLLEQSYIPSPAPDQCWQRWPIRLYKAAKSAKLFGLDTHFESLKKYANDLMRQGEDMSYGRDLSWLFR